MKKTILISLAVFSIFILASCEGETRYNWYLDNQSSSEINLDCLNYYSEDTIFKNISPGERFQLEYSEDMGGDATALNPLTQFPYMSIINAAGDTLQKDYSQLGNWEYTIEKVKKHPAIYEHEYSFVINDGDF